MGHCWHFSAKSAIFCIFFNSTEQFNEESSEFDDVTSPPVFAGLHFDFIFWWRISDKENGKLASVAMIAVDKGMTGGRCRTEETKLYRMDQKSWSGIYLLDYINDEVTKKNKLWLLR